MSLYITAFHPDGSLDVWHAEAGHGGTVPLDQIAHPPAIGPITSDDLLQVMCPVPGCGAGVIHPVSGGADPDAVQALFVLKRADEDAKAQPDAKKRRKYADVLAEVRDRAEALDGPGRFRLAGVAESDLKSGKPFDTGRAKFEAHTAEVAKADATRAKGKPA